MTLKELYNSLFSAAIASAVLFGVGHHPTVDAIILTIVWITIILAMISITVLSLTTFLVRHNEKIRNSKEMGPFYEAVGKMHKTGLSRVLSYSLTFYWLYALVVQEWTATAVAYTISAVAAFIFIFATRDIEKDYFLGRLKGEGVKNESH